MKQIFSRFAISGHYMIYRYYPLHLQFKIRSSYHISVYKDVNLILSFE